MYVSFNEMSNEMKNITQGGNSVEGTSVDLINPNDNKVQDVSSITEQIGKNDNPKNNIDNPVINPYDFIPSGPNNIVFGDWNLTKGENYNYLDNIKQFGDITSNGSMTVLNNANSGANDYTEISRTMFVPNGTGVLNFNVISDFVTNEWPDWWGTQFNDKAEIILKTPSGAYTIPYSLNDSKFYDYIGVSGLPAPMYPNGGHLGFVTSPYNIPMFNQGGQTLELILRVYNIGDNLYPSAVILK
ncbi:MAG: hypothetical protein ACI3ZR_07755, partial [bacterium]